MTHTSYKLSKALKEFLKESAPEPRGYDWYDPKMGNKLRHYDPLHGIAAPDRVAYVKQLIPAYRLEDLLSKPFCAEMRLACKWGDNSLSAANRGIEMVHDVLSMAYFHGGLPAVEKALFEMMGHKEEK